MISRVQPRLNVSSVANKEISLKLVMNTTVLGPGMDILRDDWKNKTISDIEQRLPTVKPADLLCVIFTSGSTGIPKGCMIQHQNFSSAMIY